MQQQINFIFQHMYLIEGMSPDDHAPTLLLEEQLHQYSTTLLSTWCWMLDTTREGRGGGACSKYSNAAASWIIRFFYKLICRCRRPKFFCNHVSLSLFSFFYFFRLGSFLQSCLIILSLSFNGIERLTLLLHLAPLLITIYSILWNTHRLYLFFIPPYHLPRL